MKLATVIFIVVLYFILEHSYPQSAKKKFLAFITFLLALLCSIRHLAVGNDTYAYSIHYANTIYQSWSDLLETNISYIKNGLSGQKDPGYSIVCKLFTTIGFSFEMFQFSVALIILSAIAYIVYNTVEKFSGYIISYSFYIFFFYHYLPNSATRQTIAIGFVLWSLIFIVKNKPWIWPIIFCFIGLMVHKSALLIIIPVVLFKCVNIKKLYKSVWIYSIAFIIFGFALSKYLVAFMGADQYDVYLNENGGFYAKHDRPLGYIIQMFVYYLLSLYKLPNYINNKKNRFIRMAYLCFALNIMTVGFILIDPSLNRANAYFAIWGISLLPEIIKCYDYNRTIYALIFLSLFGRILISPDDYAFMWQNKQFHSRYN